MYFHFVLCYFSLFCILKLFFHIFSFSLCFRNNFKFGRWTKIVSNDITVDINYEWLLIDIYNVALDKFVLKNIIHTFSNNMYTFLYLVLNKYVIFMCTHKGKSFTLKKVRWLLSQRGFKSCLYFFQLVLLNFSTFETFFTLEKILSLRFSRNLTKI